MKYKIGKYTAPTAETSTLAHAVVAMRRSRLSTVALKKSLRRSQRNQLRRHQSSGNAKRSATVARDGALMNVGAESEESPSTNMNAATVLSRPSDLQLPPQPPSSSSSPRDSSPPNPLR